MLLSFCLNPIAFVALRLGRFWCETGAITLARADESGLTSIGLYRRTLFKMIIERIDLALSRLKQGFDSPRERQQYQWLTPLSARAFNVFFKFSSTQFLRAMIPLTLEE